MCAIIRQIVIYHLFAGLVSCNPLKAWRNNLGINLTTRLEQYQTKEIFMQLLAKEYSRNLANMMLHKVNALFKIKKKILDMADENIQYQSNYEYLNLRYNRNVRIEIVYSTSIAVNLSHSFVQVPTDVFDGSKEIIRTAQFTKGLDKVFIENYKHDATCAWQYFGSYTGLWRNYPGFHKHG